MSREDIRKAANYDLASGYSWYVPDLGGILVLVLLFIVGALLGSLVYLLFAGLFGQEAGADFGMLLMYPVQFIPPLIYARNKSMRNSMFDTGYAIDSFNVSPLGTGKAVLLVVLGTLAASFASDVFSLVLPEMPESLKQMMDSLTGGIFIVNLVCVSVFAPLFEEWLCRGMVLRGLLNCSRSGSRQGYKPVWAIVISAAVFALIHMNLWQALPAFALGLLFGYVYYRTGSLKLTMLMHCTNNTLALCVSRIPSLGEADSWVEIMPLWAYILMCVLSCALIWYVVKEFSRVGLKRPQGNCDVVEIDQNPV